MYRPLYSTGAFRMLNPAEYCGREDDDRMWERCDGSGQKSACYFHSVSCDEPALPLLAPTEVGMAFLFAVTPMMVLTLIDPDAPHPLVRAAGALVMLLGEWERGDVMGDPRMHDGLFLRGGPLGGNESYYREARKRLLPSYTMRAGGSQLCELFAHVRASTLLADKQVIWEELGVGLLLTSERRLDGSGRQVYDWGGAGKMEDFLRAQERWNCYLGEYAAVGTDNAAVVPKYEVTLRGTLCGGISHVTNEWHFYNRSLPADLTLLTMQRSLRRGGEAPSLNLKSWRDGKRARTPRESPLLGPRPSFSASSSFDVAACLAPPSRVCPEGAPLAIPVQVRPGRTAEFVNDA